MSKLLLRVALEVIVAVSLAGVASALLVPLLIRNGVFLPGDRTGAIAIGGFIAAVVVAVVLRPGSAINRRVRR